MKHPENTTPWNDTWARRERLPFYDEAVWFGRVHVRVVRLRHCSHWYVSGEPEKATGAEREAVACFIRHAAGLPCTILHHECVWLLVWHYRQLRGGTDTRRGTIWEGVIHATGD